MEDYSTEKDRHGKQMAIGANVGLICVHSVLFVLFLIFKAYIMVGINILSILVYIFGIQLLKKNKLQEYLYLAYVEISVHMLFAIIFMGWEMGFQLYAFALIPISFLCEYSIKAITKKRTRPMLISVITGVMFLGTRFYTYNYKPLYIMKDKWIIDSLYIINTVIAFGFLMCYMAYYTKFIIKLENRLRDMAERDELTKAYNRHSMQYFLEELKESAENEGVRFNVAIIDVDNFKEINDTYGHNAGDEVLRNLVTILRKNCTANMQIARWGGEEFLVTQKFCGSAIDFHTKLESIRRKVAESRFVYQGQQIRVTITIGNATYRRHMSLEEVVQKADEKLYIGKRSGKNRVVGE